MNEFRSLVETRTLNSQQALEGLAINASTALVLQYWHGVYALSLREDEEWVTLGEPNPTFDCAGGTAFNEAVSRTIEGPHIIYAWSTSNEGTKRTGGLAERQCYTMKNGLM